MKNAKTTIAGILTFVIAGASAVWPKFAPALASIGLLLQGFGLVAAKDAGE